MSIDNSKVVVFNGVYENLYELLGYDEVLKIFEEFKGCQINFPTKLYSKEYVLKIALKEYDGTTKSINSIASKCSYSERTIRKLLQEKKSNKDCL